jgi:hypothetical protein
MMLSRGRSVVGVVPAARRRRRDRAFPALPLLLAIACLAGAGARAEAGGATILTVVDRSTVGGGTDPAAGSTVGERPIEFTLEHLDTLPQSELETITPWTDGRVRFSGVLARDLLAALAVEGERILAGALNGYRAEIPISDLSEHDVLLATRMNGAEMRIRDKGPIWVIYPASGGRLQSPRQRSKMVWQLRTLEVR